MNAVLFIGHGSKDPEGNLEVKNFVEQLAAQLPVDIVETCYLEFVQPDMMRGFSACVERGATNVIVIPIMLFSAGHAKIHIPAAIDEVREKYPHVRFIYGRPVGIHDQVLQILTTRLQEVDLPIEQEHPDTAVLVVGRGSSDPDANSELYKMSRLLWERLQVLSVETAFMGVTVPLFDAGMERCLKLGAKRIVILPYFLFTGVLMNRMNDQVAEWAKQYPEIQFTLADYFGLHPLLGHVFKDRVLEALADEVKMNCDTCQYRLAAMEHIDHHHHHHHDHGHHHDHEHHHEHHDDHDHDHHVHSQLTRS